MASEIKFGTDGWRAIIGDDFTFDNVRVCGQSVAQFLHESGMAPRGLIVGYDTRFASEDFAAAVAEVVAANGIRVLLCDRPPPTPPVSWAGAQRQGLVEVFDPEPAYFTQIKELIDLEPLRAADFKVCIDSMYGSGQGYLPGLLSGGRPRVVELHGERNPSIGR